MHANHLIRHAQQVLTVAQGKAQASGPAADPSIARSWLRCLEQYHLDPALAVAPTVLEHGRDFDEAREEVERRVAEEGLRYVHVANEPLLLAGVEQVEGRGIQVQTGHGHGHGGERDMK